MKHLRNTIMKFCEFLQKLYPYCGNGETPAHFTLTLLEKLTDEHDDGIFDKEDSYYRWIYHGKSGKTERPLPKKSASYILTHLNKNDFDSYFYNLSSDSSLEELCLAFEQEIGISTVENITCKLYDLLVKILNDIINKGKTQPQKPVQQQYIDDFEVKNALEKIVDNLSAMQQDQIDALLAYEPFNVEKKIYPKYGILKKEVLSNVVSYYKYIENLFKEASNKNTGVFNKFAALIKHKSDRYIEQNYSQPEIFDFLTEWLGEFTTCKNKVACSIMVSFFIQNCEVFNEITE